ncbi:MAG: diaminopimelate epimerase [Deltaproteobacteria bacterium]|nr:MAG: diaminopimelate epimerase [Deltaproteobacteria bacterium]
MQVRFEKWHGLGNDFVLVDEGLLPDGDVARLASTLCHRRNGIGADGLLLIRPDPPRMTVYNADGSKPEMCGNGLRCAAAWLASREGQGPPGPLRIQTDAGPHAVSVESTSCDSWVVTVRFDTLRMGVHGVEPIMAESEALGAGLLVSVGNPHWVFVGGRKERERLATVGAQLERDARFPDRINVEVAEQVSPNHWKVTVWERGCGLTQACGTGACAVAYALASRGEAPWDSELIVELPGGRLNITPHRTGAVTMVGSAVRVFRGAIDIAQDHSAQRPND